MGNYNSGCVCDLEYLKCSGYKYTGYHNWQAVAPDYNAILD